MPNENPENVPKKRYICPFCDMPKEVEPEINQIITTALTNTAVCLLKDQNKRLKEVEKLLIDFSNMPTDERERALETTKRSIGAAITQNEGTIKAIDLNALDFVTPLKSAFSKVHGNMMREMPNA